MLFLTTSIKFPCHEPILVFSVLINSTIGQILLELRVKKLLQEGYTNDMTEAHSKTEKKLCDFLATSTETKLNEYIDTNSREHSSQKLFQEIVFLHPKKTLAFNVSQQFSILRTEKFQPLSYNFSGKNRVFLKVQ